MTDTKQEIEAILRSSFEDHQLSKGERRALGQHLSSRTSHERELWHHCLYQMTRKVIAEKKVPAETVLDWQEGVARLLMVGSNENSNHEKVWFTPGDDCVQVLRGTISRALKSIDVCVFTITDDRVADELIRSVERGVRVRILTDDEKKWDPGSDIRRFVQAGIEVKTDQSPYHMHHKYAIFDNATLLNGSYNWTRGAAEKNMENIFVTSSELMLSAYRRNFSEIWQEARTILP